jgi:hypothetical protein
VSATVKSETRGNPGGEMEKQQVHPDVAAIAKRLTPRVPQQPEGTRDELFVPGA